jgi:hypothetical protein
MGNGIALGIGGTVVALVFVMASFGLGRESVASNCNAYGKSEVGGVLYVCAKEKK